MGYCTKHKEHYVSYEGCASCEKDIMPDRDKIAYLNIAIAMLQHPENFTKDQMNDNAKQLDKIADSILKKWM